MAARENKKTVEKMWNALSAMDWQTLKSCLHEKVHYEDVPSDDPGAHGPENVVNATGILMNPDDGLRTFCSPSEIAYFEYTNVLASEGMKRMIFGIW